MSVGETFVRYGKFGFLNESIMVHLVENQGNGQRIPILFGTPTKHFFDIIQLDEVEYFFLSVFFFQGGYHNAHQ